MEIKKELVDDLNAVLKVAINAEDYQDKVQTALKSHQRQAEMPGFRKGKVPFSLIKKRYGVAVKVEEINKILGESIQKYIDEEKLDILGSPMPQPADDINWDNDSFEFAYDLGLAPEFEVKLDKRSKFKKYIIKADAEMVENQIKQISSQFGTMSNPDTIEDEDLFTVDVTGTFGEEEINNNSTLSTNRLSDDVKKMFIGKKVEDKVEVKLEDVYESNAERASLIGKQEADAETFEGTFTFEVKTISRMTPAELNEELFAKVFPNDEVKDEETFRAKLNEEITKQLTPQSVNRFKNDVIETIIEKTKIDLPKAFLAKWIADTSEKEITAEEVEKDFENYEKGLKWQLIEGKLIKDNDLKVEFDEIKAKTLELINANMAQYGQPPVADEQADEFIMSVLKNQDEARRINEMLFEDKVIEVIENSCKIEEEEISYEDFIKLVTDKK